MTLKPLLAACVVCAGLMMTSSSASAGDWWNPGSWRPFRPAYPAAYPPNCENGACLPGRAAWRPDYCPGGDCDLEYGNGRHGRPAYPRGYRTPAPVVPGYRPDYSSPRDYRAPVMPNTWDSNYPAARNLRPNYSPFYE